MYLLHASWHSSATLTEVFLCFFLSCKANAWVKTAKTGHGPHCCKIFVLFYVLFALRPSVYCLCVNVYCTTATRWLPNFSEQIYIIISYYVFINNTASHLRRPESNSNSCEHPKSRILSLAFCVDIQ